MFFICNHFKDLNCHYVPFCYVSTTYAFIIKKAHEKAKKCKAFYSKVEISFHTNYAHQSVIRLFKYQFLVLVLVNLEENDFF